MCKKILYCLTIFVLFSIVSCSGSKDKMGILEKTSEEQEVIPFCYNGKYGLIDSERNVIASTYGHTMVSEICRKYVLWKENSDSNEFSILNSTGKKLFTLQAMTGYKYWISQNFLFMSTYDDYNNKSYTMLEIPPFKVHAIPTTSRYITDMFCTLFSNEDSKFPIALIDWELKPRKAAYYTADMKREIDVPFAVQHLMPMVDDAAVVVTEDFDLVVIDCTGNVIVKDVWDCGWNFTEGLLPVKLRDRSGFINNKGEFVFECPISLDYYGYERAPKGTPNLKCSFCEGLAYVPVSKTEWNVYDKEGVCLAEGLKFLPRTGSVFRDGLLCVYDKDGSQKYGYIDKYGKLIIPCIFTDAEDFRGGYAIVVYNEKDALVDKNGNLYYTADIMAGNKDFSLSVKTE